MGYNVGGGAEPVQMRIGATAIQKVMVGTVQVWPKPLPAAVQIVSSAGVVGTWTHAAGDLLVILTQSLTTNPPVAPVAGGTVPEWLPFISQQGASYGGSTINLSVHYAWATANNHTAGGWTNQSRQWVYVLRNADKTNPFGSGSSRMDSVGGQYYPSAPAVTLERSNSLSVTLHHLGWNNSASVSWQSQPTGATSAYNTFGTNGWWVGHRAASSNNVAQVPMVSGQLTGPANVAAGVSLEIVPARQ